MLIIKDGSELDIADAADGFSVFPERETIAMLRNGEPSDLATVLVAGDIVDAIAISSTKGLEILRHSTAHILAQAVQNLYPDARLGIGPPIEDGFYYDFLVAEPFSSDDLAALQKEMHRLVKSGQRFTRREVTDAQALAELATEQFKTELIALKGSSNLEEGGVEVGAGALSIYDNVDMNTGGVVWSDLCRGPHVPNSRTIGKGFALTRVSAAYWRGDQARESLQRIYGTAWSSKEDLDQHLQRLEEAAKRDHRKLGQELDLFSFPSDIGSGLPIFHPKGGVIRRVMEDYSRSRHEQAGYEFVYTPHITKSNLFEASGHLQWYADGMFPPMHMDAEHNEDGTIKRQGQDYYLKPMNCPFHILVFKSRARSYRELPLRLFEFGSVYRYEKSGVVHGLTRVRGMTQDDAHLFVTEEDLETEIEQVLEFVLRLLRDYGLDDFYLELSTRGDSDKFVGTDENWESATATLRKVAEASGLELVPDPGGAAFYGPKISIQARDAIGRTWQMSTIQLDFNLPHRFDLEYVGSDGERHQPIMIHRALFGSIERFFGVLTEHYAGHFPPWLAPVQVVLIPVSAEQDDYVMEFSKLLKEQGVRVEVDLSDDRMQKKIRNWTLQKAPFILLAGGNDQSDNAISFRYRDGNQVNGVKLDEAIELIVNAIESRVQV